MDKPSSYISIVAACFFVLAVARLTNRKFGNLLRLGYEIVHPLTTESWGVRRFFVRAPDGNVFNVVQHRE